MQLQTKMLVMPVLLMLLQVKLARQDLYTHDKQVADKPDMMTTDMNTTCAYK